jgi:hypothetical protein
VAFTNFTSVEEIAIKYGISFQRKQFVVPVEGVTVSEYFRKELDFTLSDVPFQRSEGFTCEAVIYPVLREVWKSFHTELTLLSHEAIVADSELRGEVDYIICKRSHLGPLISDKPYVLIGEAKKDDSTGGWSQALGGMLAAQKIDGKTNRTFFGLTTTGLAWRFGKLERAVFTQDPNVYGLGDLDELAGALHFVFTACRDQLRATPPA